MTTQSMLVVRYAETDQMGIAHHSNYPIWYEIGRTDFIKATGVSYSELERLGVMTPLVGLSCHYISPAYYEDVLVVETCVQAVTPARVEFGYTIRRMDEEKPINTGSTAHAWVDSQTFRPISLKKRLPELFAKMQAMARSE